MAYPSTLTSFSNPLATNRLNAPSHSSVETAQNTALAELQNYIGVNTGATASVVGTLLYDIKAPGSSGGGHVQTANTGGTGQISFVKGDVLIAQSSSVLGRLGLGSDGQALVATSATNLGVSWGSIAGVATPVKTMFPTAPLKPNAISKRIATPSLMTLGQVYFPTPINASVITMQAGDAVNVGGTLDFTLYSENGSASILTLTSPTFGAAGDVIKMYLPSVQSIPQGNYYVATNTNGTADFETFFWTYTVPAGTSSILQFEVLPGMPVLEGNYTIPAGAPPSSIVTTAIRSVLTATGAGTTAIFRIDG